MIFSIGHLNHRFRGVPRFKYKFHFIRPKLTSVGLENNTLCNRKCEWCPNNTNKIVSRDMSWEVFDKIIDNLKSMRFTGRVSFNRFNEPLIDKRLPEFIGTVRKKLPKTHIYINSNGDLLTMELWKKLREAGLNYANIAIKDAEYPEHIKKIFDALNWRERQAFGLHLFNKNKTHNWAGNIDSNYNTPLKKICVLPFYQMVIDYKGQAVLCCRDYSREVKLDVMNSSIKDVWEGDTFEHYRRHLIKGNRTLLTPCSKCAP